MLNENFKKVLGYLKTKRGASLVTVFIAVLLGSIFLYNNHVKIENLKADLLKTQEKLPSENEKKLIEYTNKIKEFKNKFIEAEKRKIEAEKEMKEYKNFEDCFKQQIDRVVDGKESLLNYCDEKFNQKNLIPTSMSGANMKSASIKRSVVRNDWDINDKRQDYINYVYERAGKDALLTFTGENTLWTKDRPSTMVSTAGGRDYGFCQLNYYYHKKFIDSADFQDPYKQLDYCIGVYKDGEKRGILPTTFYAYNGRFKWTYLFNFS